MKSSEISCNKVLRLLPKQPKISSTITYGVFILVSVVDLAGGGAATSGATRRLVCKYKGCLVSA